MAKIFCFHVTSDVKFKWLCCVHYFLFFFSPPENTVGNRFTKKNVPKPANFKWKEEKVIIYIKTAFSQEGLSCFRPIRKQKKFHVIYVATVRIKLHWVQIQLAAFECCAGLQVTMQCILENDWNSKSEKGKKGAFGLSWLWWILNETSCSL